MEGKKVLITGGSGYLGKLMIPALIEKGYQCISVDVRTGTPSHPQVRFVRVDACKLEALEQAIGDEKIDFILHLATEIDFAVASQKSLYQNNVESTRSVAQLAGRYQIPKVIFISSSSAYLGTFKDRPLSETDTPIPADEYGRSKIDSEKVLLEYATNFNAIIIRCPAVIDASRLGIFSIIFDFIRSGKKCWLLGQGNVPYQTLYVPDLTDACLKSLDKQANLTFNIGCDRVPTLREMYQQIIDFAQTTARVASIPQRVALPLMKMTYHLGISPLGPVQFRMLTKGFEFDNSYIKHELNWTPTLSTNEMLLKAYEYYIQNYQRLAQSDISANGSIITNTGILRIVKFFS
jgi:UDP-glucose 4-epimerase